MIKVYVISNMYPSKEDAYFGVFVKNFCESFNKKDGINIVAKSVIEGQGKNLLSKMLKYFSFYFHILYKGFFEDYDVIYVHNVSHSVLPVYILLLRKRIKMFKLVLNPHGEDMLITHRLDGFLLKLSLPLIRTADQIVCPSEFYKQAIVDRYKLPLDKIFVSASGGVDLNMFRPQINSGNSLTTKRIGYVSRLSSQKGWNTLLYAVKMLIKSGRFRDVKLVVVGKGESEFEFMELIKELHLENYVEYLGFKSQQALPTVFNSLDVFIFPTLMLESLGLVGLEAMACGIPVIGSNRGGIGDYLVDSQNGFQFNAGDASDLTLKIERFYDLDRDERVSMSKQCLVTASRFSRENIKNEMVKNLFTLIKR